MSPTPPDMTSAFCASYEADCARIFGEAQQRERKAFLSQAAARVVAGAEAEITAKETLFSHLFAEMTAGECFVGALPCLRDNSPESARFQALAHTMLWEFWMAEELREIVGEAGFGFLEIRFVPNMRWNDAVLKGQLRFVGYYPIFEKMMAEGYDPMEIGWGEMWCVGRKGEEGICENFHIQG